MATCSRACQPCGLSSRGAISDQELGKLRKRRCNTRVPVKTLIDYLQGGDRLEDFLNDFPTVTKNRALQVLDLAKDALLSNLDETLAI